LANKVVGAQVGRCNPFNVSAWVAARRRAGAPGWRPNRFGFELFGCRHKITFPAVKLLDFAPRLPALLEDPNPFALLRACEFLLRERPWPR